MSEETGLGQINNKIKAHTKCIHFYSRYLCSVLVVVQSSMIKFCGICKKIYFGHVKQHI